MSDMPEKSQGSSGDSIAPPPPQWKPVVQEAQEAMSALHTLQNRWMKSSAQMFDSLPSVLPPYSSDPSPTREGFSRPGLQFPCAEQQAAVTKCYGGANAASADKWAALNCRAVVDTYVQCSAQTSALLHTKLTAFVRNPPAAFGGGPMPDEHSAPQ